MYQITALYQDCEIAHSEGDDYMDVINQVCEQVSDSVYSELEPDDIDLSIIKQGHIATIHCKASMYW